MCCCQSVRCCFLPSTWRTAAAPELQLAAGRGQLDYAPGMHLVASFITLAWQCDFACKQAGLVTGRWYCDFWTPGCVQRSGRHSTRPALTRTLAYPTRVPNTVCKLCHVSLSSAPRCRGLQHLKQPCRHAVQRGAAHVAARSPLALPQHAMYHWQTALDLLNPVSARSVLATYTCVQLQYAGLHDPFCSDLL